MIKQIPSNKIKDFIKENPKSILLDVRTKEEWDQIGKPDGDKIGIKTYFLSSQFHGRIINENFVKEFESLKIDGFSLLPGSESKLLPIVSLTN